MLNIATAKSKKIITFWRMIFETFLFQVVLIIEGNIFKECCGNSINIKCEENDKFHQFLIDPYNLRLQPPTNSPNIVVVRHIRSNQYGNQQKKKAVVLSQWDLLPCKRYGAVFRGIRPISGRHVEGKYNEGNHYKNY